MGKKKKARQAAEAAARDRTERGAANSPASGPLAGIAAAVARQMATPAGRQMIAAGLVAAAGAITRPQPPAPPATPEAPAAPAPPSDPTTPQPAGGVGSLPPEAARVIGLAASALERWAQGLTKPPQPPVG